MQYTFSLTPRMMTLAVICLILLCLLLFVAGIEIGKKMSLPTQAPKMTDISKSLALPKPPKIPAAASELLAPAKP